MGRHIVKCRLCKEQFDANLLIQGEEWIMPTRNMYYHINCYNDWATKKNDVHAVQDESAWLSATWDFLVKDLKIPINFHKMKKQWDSLIRAGRTPKGIYFTLRYFYDVKKGQTDKAKEGIGIVGYIYEEGTAYWVQREKKDKGICERITMQLEQFKKYEENKSYKRVERNKKTKNKLGNIDDIELMEERW